VSGAAARPFVVVGESLVDVVVVEGADGEERHEALGGSCLNVAVGMSRLDVPTVLITQVGDDDRGKALVDHAHGSGVRLAEGSVVPGGTTSTSTARLDAQHAATYDFEMVWDLPRLEMPAEASGLHVGSLGTAVDPGRWAVFDLARRTAEEELFVSYDPNVRPFFIDDMDQAWREVVELASYSRLVKLSDEDLRTLRPGDDEEEVCRELLSAERTELVVLTRGPDGAAAFSDGMRVSVPAPETEVVDTVGAGDSFMSAVLALLCRWDVVTAGEGALDVLADTRVELLLRGAVRAAALTCSRRGADPPTTQELPTAWPAG
jgi:fructokinase